MGGLVGDPAGLLRVIGLGLELELQLGGDDQPSVSVIKLFFFVSDEVVK